MDFDLWRPSSRVFEHLVQALCLKVIGPQVTPFGDGPDGGREATFEGRTNFPDAGDPWIGYGVIQAKHKQRSEGTAKDNEWALRELSKELASFRDHPARRKPNYYVYACNVSLTAAEGKGGLDKAEQLLLAAKDTLGLSGHQIWDYNKLARFLELSAELRRSYSAWITTGDVLAQVIDALPGLSASFEQTLDVYLQKELLADQHAKLEQAGTASEKQIPISSVMIDLPVAQSGEALMPPDETGGLTAGFLNELIKSSDLRLKHDYQQQELRGDPRAYVPGTWTGRYVLIGGPGQGKTTIGQFACQLLRASILEHRQNLPREVSEAIAAIKAAEGPDLPLPRGRRFPIRVVLNEFAAKLASDDHPEIDSLLAFVAWKVGRRAGVSLGQVQMRLWLRSYPWFIVLDGLDEVPSSSNRAAVLSAIQDFWIDCANADVLVLATTRPQGYNEEFAPEYYIHRTLAPLEPQRALLYARKLASARHALDEDRREVVYERLSRAAANEATARLMQSPLQVTIMATLLERLGQAPQESWELFRSYYRTIYDREIEKRIPAAQTLASHRPDIDEIHRRVGLILHVRSELEGHTDARLTQTSFENIVRGHLREEGYEGKQLEALQKMIVDAAAERLVFLVGVEASRIGFEIRALQEFMAAWALMEGSDEAIKGRLEVIAGCQAWHNVFLFAAGRAFVDRQHLRDAVFAVCAGMNIDDQQPLMAATLGGSQLCLNVLTGGVLQGQPKYTRLLTKEALELIRIGDLESVVSLAAAYCEDTGPFYKARLEECVRQTEPTVKDAALALAVSLASQGVTWAEAFVLKNRDYAADRIGPILEAAFVSGPLPSDLAEVVGNALLSVSPVAYEFLFYDAQRVENCVPRGDARARCRLVGRLTRAGTRRMRGVSLTVEGDKVPLALSAISSEVPSSDWAPLAQLEPREAPLWGSFIAVARFYRTGGARGLSEALRAVADSLEGLGSVPPLTTIWPWPLANVVAHTSSAEELRMWGNAAEAGRLGSERSWHEAESRWIEAGAPVEELGAPLAEYDGYHPFPFRVSDVEFVTQDGGPVNLLALVNYVLRLRDEAGCVEGASIIANAYGFVSAASYEFGAALKSGRQASSAVDEMVTPWPLPSVAWVVETTAVRRWESYSDFRKDSLVARAAREGLIGIDVLMEYLGGQPYFSVFDMGHDIEKALVDHYSASRDVAAIQASLKIHPYTALSPVAATWVRETLSLLHVGDVTSDEGRVALLYVKARWGVLTLEDATATVPSVVTMMEGAEQGADIVGHVIDSVGDGPYGSSDGPEQFLLAVFAEATAREAYPISQRARFALRELSAYRRTQLGVPETWDRLGLPVGALHAGLEDAGRD